MPGKDLLSCLDKRNLLNNSVVSTDALVQWGLRYEEAELLSDAVDFYEKAGAVDEMIRLKEAAKLQGDLFLFNRLCRILKMEPSVDEWVVLAKEAEARGKHSFAQQAYRKSGREDVVREPAETIVAH